MNNNSRLDNLSQEPIENNQQQSAPKIKTIKRFNFSQIQRMQDHEAIEYQKQTRLNRTFFGRTSSTQRNRNNQSFNMDSQQIITYDLANSARRFMRQISTEISERRQTEQQEINKIKEKINQKQIYNKKHSGLQYPQTFSNDQDSLTDNNNETRFYGNTILYDNYSEQSNVILEYLFGKKEQQNIRNTHRKWIIHLDKYKDVDLEPKIQQFGLRNPKYANISRVKKEMDLLYKNNQRKLTIGEEATIIETIIRILKKVDEEPEQLLVSLQSMIQRILGEAELTKLNKYQSCIKQIELHWKIMATRYRSRVNIQDKRLEKVYSSVSDKSHFINLANNNILVKYLLKYSSANQ